jgi:alanyl-tRNA synthetase
MSASVNDIRSHFLSYFEKNGHTPVASGSLVPRNDPTLMFTNAGMVPFKDYFTGRAAPPFPRATSSQKCVRAGGKHNDLDNVGYTARHHTFFEMLGNFSFGDYFKERAIELAWNLVTREFGLAKDRLMVTVYSEDDHAFDLWKKIAGFPDEKIVRIATSDNFWAMGDTGPCGPCSEIFYDHGADIPGGPPGSPDADGDRFIEIWNLVFMQFEQTPDGRVDLPKPSIDTGMGLERIAAVLQGVHDNYDIDLFRTLIAASVEVIGVAAEGPARASHRVIADHLRASSFLIADGVLPSNEGRGYVLRRIMRRAMRHAHLLGANEPVMYRLVPTLVAEMGRAYPELVRAEALITETLRLEETRFRRTLARGLVLLDEETAGYKPGATLAGDVAFRLYDTYGFPLDLTQDALKARGIQVDMAGFNQAMEKQKDEARASWAGSGEAQTESVWFKLRDTLGATEFLGYETESAEGEILAIVRNGEPVEKAGEGEEVAILVNQTPFYAESGGQVGDTGLIAGDRGGVLVNDVQKRADGLFVHYGKVENGTVAVGDAVRLAVDGVRRGAVRANHSATHLLHAALRNVLGSHVAQKGSLVAPDRLRFDFSHPKPVDAHELEAVEDLANKVLLQDAPVVTRLMDREEAMNSGAMALFGEKYGDTVRVVSMGAMPGGVPGKDYSVELCGGTHVRRTGEIGLVTVVGEAGVAAGVRRIEALTGAAARHHLAQQEKRLKAVALALKVSPDEAAERVATLVEERRRLERELAEARKKLALGGGGDGANPVIEVGGVKFYRMAVSGLEMNDLKALADQGKASVGSGVVAIANTSGEGKASLVVGVTGDLTSRFNAIELVRKGAAAVGGKGGGGRPDLAQAGGPEGDKAGAALDAVEAALRG